MTRRLCTAFGALLLTLLAPAGAAHAAEGAYAAERLLPGGPGGDVRLEAALLVRDLREHRAHALAERDRLRLTPAGAAFLDPASLKRDFGFDWIEELGRLADLAAPKGRPLPAAAAFVTAAGGPAFQVVLDAAPGFTGRLSRPCGGDRPSAFLSVANGLVRGEMRGVPIVGREEEGGAVRFATTEAGLALGAGGAPVLPPSIAAQVRGCGEVLFVPGGGKIFGKLVGEAGRAPSPPSSRAPGASPSGSRATARGTPRRASCSTTRSSSSSPPCSRRRRTRRTRSSSSGASRRPPSMPCGCRRRSSPPPSSPSPTSSPRRSCRRPPRSSRRSRRSTGRSATRASGARATGRSACTSPTSGRPRRCSRPSGSGWTRSARPSRSRSCARSRSRRPPARPPPRSASGPAPARCGSASRTSARPRRHPPAGAPPGDARPAGEEGRGGEVAPRGADAGGAREALAPHRLPGARQRARPLRRGRLVRPRDARGVPGGSAQERRDGSPSWTPSWSGSPSSRPSRARAST